MTIQLPLSSDIDALTNATEKATAYNKSLVLATKRALQQALPEANNRYRTTQPNAKMKISSGAVSQLLESGSMRLARLSSDLVLGVGVVLVVLLIGGCTYPPSAYEPVIGGALVVEQPTSIDPNAPPDSLIIGTWELQKTIMCGRLGYPEERTPAVAGYTEQRKFRRDGQVEFYKDRRLTGIYQYSVKQLRILPGDTMSVTEVWIGGGDSIRQGGTATIEPNFLQYGSCDRDGVDEQYVRLQN